MKNDDFITLSHSRYRKALIHKVNFRDKDFNNPIKILKLGKLKIRKGFGMKSSLNGFEPSSEENLQPLKTKLFEDQYSRKSLSSGDDVPKKILLNFSPKEIPNFLRVSDENYQEVCEKIKFLLQQNRKFSHVKVLDKNVSFTVLDVELTKSQILLGLYFENTKTYLGIYLSEESSSSDIDKIKKLISFMLESLMDNTQENFQVLLTFNGESYDLRIINFLLSNSFKFPEVYQYSCCLIKNVPWVSKFGEKSEWAYLYNMFSKKGSIVAEKLIHVDVFKISQAPRNEQKTSALNSYKFKNWKKLPNKTFSEIFHLSPLEYYFSKEIIDYSKPIKNYNFWVLYNYNDTFHTYCTFMNQKGLEYLQTRISFLSDMKVDKPLAQIIKLTNPQLALALPGADDLIPESVKLKSTKVVFDNLIFIEKYPKVFDSYKNFFQKAQYYPESKTSEALKHEIVIPRTKQSIIFSRGGLHSKTLNYIVCFDVTNTEFVIFDLDLQSFYTNILIKICEVFGTDLQNLKNTLETMNTERVKIKKTNPTLSSIYKIIILSITGNLNQVITRNPFTCPLLYFSMTANGQLLLSEFLFQLAEEVSILEDLIFANTDGACIKIKKENEKILNKTIENFQNHYGFEFDTKISIQKGILFNVNHYIFLKSDGSFISKGFMEDNFNFIKTIFQEILKSYSIKSFQMINKDVLLETFKSFLKSFQKDPTTYLPSLLGYESYKGDKAFYYFSKTPSNSSGVALNGSNFKSNFPTKILNIGELYLQFIKSSLNYSDFITFLVADLDFVSYLKFLFSTVNNFRENSEGESLELLTLSVEDLNNVFGPNYYEENSILRNALKFSNSGLYVFPKLPDKKNFPKMPQIVNFEGNNAQSKTKSIQVSANDSFFNSLKFFPQNWLNATTLCINIKPSFPFVVLDFDSIDFMFSKNSRFQNSNLMDILNSWKERSGVIFSSPTKERILKFKILLKAEHFSNPEEFSTAIKSLQTSNIPISYEDLASIYGTNLRGQSLISNLNFNTLPTIRPEDIELLKSPKEISEEAYFKLLLNFVEILHPKLYNHLVKYFDPETKNLSNSVKVLDSCLPQNQEAFDFSKILEFKEKFFINEKFALNSLLNSLFSPQAFDSLDTQPLEIPLHNLFLSTQNSSSQMSYSQDTFQNYDIMKTPKQKRELQLAEVALKQSLLKVKNLNNSFILNSQNQNFYQSKNFDFNRLPLNLNNIKLVQSLVFLAKETYGLDFKFKNFSINLEDPTPDIPKELIEGDNTEGFELVSHCIFETEDKDSRVVTLFLQPTRLSINCFHQPCKEGKRYLKIAQSLNSYFISLRLLFHKTPFKKIDVSTKEVFDSLSSDITEESLNSDITEESLNSIKDNNRGVNHND